MSPTVTVKLLKSGDPAPFPHDADRRLVDHSGPITVVVLEHGMASGKHSVAIRAEIGGESPQVVYLHTSAAVFLAAARCVEAMADTTDG